MYEANVAATERVLDAAIAAGRPAHRRRLDRQRVRQHARAARRRDLPARPAEGFLSYYDETKYRAHVAAEARIAAGAPIVIVHARDGLRRRRPLGLGAQLEAAYDGTARFIVFGEHRDLGRPRRRSRGGIVAALDRGRIGESYVLTGE